MNCRPDSLLPLNAACARIGKSRATLYRMSERGEIELVKLGASTMVRESEVIRIVMAAKPLRPAPFPLEPFRLRLGAAGPADAASFAARLTLPALTAAIAKMAG